MNCQNTGFNSSETTLASHEYASMTYDEATKNHPGGIQDYSSVGKEGRIYSTDDPLFHGLNCLKIYLQKVNSDMEALFQCPKRGLNLEEPVWYEIRPL